MHLSCLELWIVILVLLGEKKNSNCTCLGKNKVSSFVYRTSVVHREVSREVKQFEYFGSRDLEVTNRNIN